MKKIAMIMIASVILASCGGATSTPTSPDTTKATTTTTVTPVTVATVTPTK